MIDDHAKTPDGLPLIGIPPEAAEEKCSKCGMTVHISNIVIDENWKQVCKPCNSNDPTHSQPREASLHVRRAVRSYQTVARATNP